MVLIGTLGASEEEEGGGRRREEEEEDEDEEQEEDEAEEAEEGEGWGESSLYTSSHLPIARSCGKYW